MDGKPVEKDDIIELGRYGGTPLRWRVLSVGEDTIRLIAEKVIDAGSYASPGRGRRMQPWSTSPIRSRLQQLFERGFSLREKLAVISTHYRLATVDADGTTELIDESDDFISLLSREQAEELFAPDTTWTTKHGFERPSKNLDRLCEVEPRALESGLASDEKPRPFCRPSPSAYCAYWLLGPAKSMDDWVRCVASSGRIEARSGSEILGVRPTMVVRRAEYPVVGTFRYEEVPEEETPRTFETIRMGSWKGMPLDWRILKRAGDRMLVLSERGLEEMPFGVSYNAQSYPWSGLRTWLNQDFFGQAFTDDEKRRIIVGTVRTPKSPTDIGALSGPPSCEDPLFPLLFDDLEELLPSIADLRCYPLEGGDEPVGWWLRDHCTLADQQFAIAEDWLDDTYGFTHVPHDRAGIYARPAMWVRA